MQRCEVIDDVGETGVMPDDQQAIPCCEGRRIKQALQYCRAGLIEPLIACAVDFGQPTRLSAVIVGGSCAYAGRTPYFSWRWHMLSEVGCHAWSDAMPSFIERSLFVCEEFIFPRTFGMS